MDTRSAGGVFGGVTRRCRGKGSEYLMVGLSNAGPASLPTGHSAHIDVPGHDVDLGGRGDIS
jgi:hypothetical protein